MKKKGFLFKKFKRVLLVGITATVISGFSGANKPNKVSDFEYEKQLATLKDVELPKVISRYEVEQKEMKNIKEQQSNMEEKLSKVKDKREQLIEKYANVYNLNEKKTVKIIENNTNYLDRNVLLTTKNNKKMEYKLLLKIRDIKSNPEKYNIKLKEIEENDYKKTTSIRQMVIHYAKLYGVDPLKALAIEFYESNYYLSNVARNKNNPGGQRANGSYYTFENLEQGIIDHMRTLTHYKNQSLYQMQDKYCPGSGTWAYGISQIYNNLKENINAYELYDENKNDLKNFDEYKKTETNEKLNNKKETKTKKKVKNTKFKKYSLSKEKLTKVAAICMAEQGSSINGVKWEASLICNRADGKVNGKDPYTVSQSRWFASGSRRLSANSQIGKRVGNRGILTKKIYNTVYDVVVNGNRVTDAIEHDSFSDIKSIEINGKKYTSRKEISNRNNYVKEKTIINNFSNSRYLFSGFPTNHSDPFGVDIKKYKRK